MKTGLFGSKVSFVPIAEARESDGDVRLPYDKEQVKDAPTRRPTASSRRRRRPPCTAITGSTIRRPARTRGCPRATAASRPRETVGHDTSGPTTDDAMTRSEEELQVGTEQGERRARPAAQVRGHRAGPEDRSGQREEVRVEREPITDANVGDATSGPDISEEEHEVTLHEEDGCVDKRAVPEERVRLEKDTVTEDQTVSEEVRKEQIETEGGHR